MKGDPRRVRLVKTRMYGLWECVLRTSAGTEFLGYGISPQSAEISAWTKYRRQPAG